MAFTCTSWKPHPPSTMAERVTIPLVCRCGGRGLASLGQSCQCKVFVGSRPHPGHSQALACSARWRRARTRSVAFGLVAGLLALVGLSPRFCAPCPGPCSCVRLLAGVALSPSFSCVFRPLCGGSLLACSGVRLCLAPSACFAGRVGASSALCLLIVLLVRQRLALGTPPGARRAGAHLGTPVRRRY